MKKKWKQISISVLSLILLSSNIVLASAENIYLTATEAQEQEILHMDIYNAPIDIVEMIAHMDISAASRGMSDIILTARNIIIFGDQMWSAHGGSFVTNPDGTRIYAPLFSDVFPGWDLPKVRDTEDVAIAGQVMGIAPFNNTQFDGNVHLAAPPADTMSAPFFRFNNGSSRTATAHAFSAPSDLVNIGLTNEDTGLCHDWFPNLNRLQVVTFNNLVNGTRYGVRASTNGTTGMARMRVNQ